MVKFLIVRFVPIFIICIFVFLLSCVFTVKSKKTKDDFHVPHVLCVPLLLTGDVLLAELDK